jgi:type I restriction-modification system DNA methylase subunit
MFQNVMTPSERRQLGAHYTTEENIMRTIRPLFLDELEAELEGIKVSNSSQSRANLNGFQNKLASLSFIDPACGCGNFLVIAYREIRRLELEVLRKLAIANKLGVKQVMDVAHLLKVNVGQFYGIEIEEFPARIARTALYLMDHKENLDVSKEFGQYFARFPIPSSPHIAIANALRIDWNEVIPAEDVDYIVGNPPFVGQANRSDEQTRDLEMGLGERIQRLPRLRNWVVHKGN